jgi:uncharacterized protein
MAEMTSYRPGTPNWVDVSSSDIPRSTAFYAGLFGWEVQDLGPDAGGYGFFLKNGKTVAGFGPAWGDAPPNWTTYISLPDVDAAVAKVADAGGTVLAPPMDLPNDSGRMAVTMDPAGAVISFYTPRSHIGATLVNEANTLVWNELTSRNLDASLAYLEAVTGNTSIPMESDGEGGGPVDYRLIQANGRTVAGSMQMGDEFPPDMPSHWMVYFAVDDVDAAAARATELGGTVMVPPMDMAVGRFSVIVDPVGAALSVMTLHQIDDPNS